jgi:hypothetical protein
MLRKNKIIGGNDLLGLLKKIENKYFELPNVDEFKPSVKLEKYKNKNVYKSILDTTLW